MLKFILNGTECINPPIGANDISERLYYSEVLKGYFLELEGTVTFFNEDYETLRNIFDNNYCEEVSIDILKVEENELVFRGFIKTSDIEWDKVKSQAICEIVDDSFMAKIDNNKNIKFKLGVPRSKNDVDISSRTVLYNTFNFFSPFYGRYFDDEAVGLEPAKRTGMFLYDAFNFLIAAMTDDTVDFDSNYLTYNIGSPSNDTEAAWTALINALELKTGTGVDIYISFEELFTDVQKLLNLAISVERQANNRPLIRIEDYDYYKQQDSNIYFTTVDSLIEKINIDRQYARIIIGCSTRPEDFPLPDVPLAYQNQEEYHLKGQCNIDSEFDLRMQNVIIHSNSIRQNLPSVSGFTTAQLIAESYTNFANNPFELEDPAADFTNADVQVGDIAYNSLDNTYTYITAVTAQVLTLQDDIFNGPFDNYKIYKPDGNPTDDEDTILVHLDKNESKGSDILAYKSEFTFGGITQYYYNDFYSNANVLTRHQGSIPQDVAIYLGDGNDVFSAETNTYNQSSNALYFFNTFNSDYKRIRFDIEITDPNSNYDPVTGIYTVPADGAYEFQSAIGIKNANYTGFSFFQCEMWHTDSANTVLKSVPVSQDVLFVPNGTEWYPSISGWINGVFNCEAGDLIYCVIARPSSTSAPFAPTGQFNGLWGYIAESFFNCNAVANGGGVYQPGSADEAFVVNLEFNNKLDSTTWNNLKATPYKYLNVQYGENKFDLGYPEEINRNVITGETTVRLLRKKSGI
jgi:hypothetical protein